jgi:hypothetical protein
MKIARHGKLNGIEKHEQIASRRSGTRVRPDFPQKYNQLSITTTLL